MVESSPTPQELIESAREELPHVVAARELAENAEEIAKRVLFRRNGAVSDELYNSTDADLLMATANAVVRLTNPENGFVHSGMLVAALHWAQTKTAVAPEASIMVVRELARRNPELLEAESMKKWLKEWSGLLVEFIRA